MCDWASTTGTGSETAESLFGIPNLPLSRTLSGMLVNEITFVVSLLTGQARFNARLNKMGLVHMNLTATTAMSEGESFITRVNARNSQ